MRAVIQSYMGASVGVCNYRGGFTEATVIGIEPHINHLGGQWATVTIQLPDGTHETLDSRAHVFLGPEHREMAWCPECLTRREVVDRDNPSRYAVVGELEQTCTSLDCGHTIYGEERIVGPSPGAPYAEDAVATIKDVQKARMVSDD